MKVRVGHTSDWTGAGMGKRREGGGVCWLIVSFPPSIRTKYAVQQHRETEDDEGGYLGRWSVPLAHHCESYSVIQVQVLRYETRDHSLGAALSLEPRCPNPCLVGTTPRWSLDLAPSASTIFLHFDSASG